MFPDANALQSAIIEKDPGDFVSYFMFEPVPFAFNSDLGAWITWKTELARGLEVDPRDIVLTGSAAVGFSLNPNKDFRPFHDKSDIDCGVISPYHFDIAWRQLRKMRPSWLSLPARNKRAIESHRKNYVFSGAIATDVILGLLPFGAAWRTALDAMSNKEPTVGREINVRIYRDYDALRQYQAINLRKLRDSIVAGADEEAIFDVQE